ncbi:MAG: cell surface protein SprA, partial [Catalinimonas sp.]
PVVLRFAEMQLVANQWRPYILELREAGEGFDDEDNSGFLVSTVNIEENGDDAGGTVTPYVVPPGFSRDRDVTQQIFRRLNEQSLSLCVDDLPEGRARAVFKNTSFDFRNYKRLQMSLHAEAQNDQTLDGEISAFVRLGTDFTDNYYEIEVPLRMTPPGTPGSAEREIWPLENEINVAFNELFGLKAERNRLGGDPLQLYPLAGKRVAEEGILPPLGQLVRVKGNPDLSSVQTIMLGIKNPTTPEDPFPKSVCIWANEMRVTDFDRQAGWAAVGRLGVTLADLATVTAAGRYETIGFGGIEQKIAQRAQANTAQFSVSSNIALDKFTPKRLGLRIPMFVSYDVRDVEPRFDPLDPDVPLEASIEALPSEQHDEYRRITRDRTERRSINFAGVSKTKTNPEARSYPWDVENLTLTYVYSEETNTNHLRESFVSRNYLGAVDYNYGSQLPPIEPFKSSEALSSPYLKLIKDFNFSPLPSNISIRGELNRRFLREQLRGADVFAPSPILPTFEKAFTFNRIYNLRWALTRALSFDYRANVQALIDEPAGEITRDVRDTILDNLENLGRIKNFNQTVQANYQVPLDKLPFTDWLRADVQYQAGYVWQAAPLGLADTSDNAIGNTVQNNNSQGVNGQIDLTKLYNKVRFLKEINTPPPPRRSARPPARPKPTDAEAEADTTEKKRELKGLKQTLRVLMSARSINFNYSRQRATLLPDYLPTVDYLGLNAGNGAPGVPFILGSQDPGIRFTAADNGWLGTSPDQTRSFTQSLNETFTAQTQLEPVRDFRIQLSARKTKSVSYSELFVDTFATERSYVSLSPSKTGNYSISYISVLTAFSPADAEGATEVFRTFEANRQVVLDDLNRQNPGDGYTLNHQDVLIPAFIAAYTGRDVTKARRSVFPNIPLPNWQVNYAGLSKLEALKEYFTNVTLTHNYTSSYTVGSFQTSLVYPIEALSLDNNVEQYNRTQFATRFPEGGGADTAWAPLYVAQGVAIQEQFSPLIGIDVRTKSKMTFRLSYNRSRNLALNVGNAQLTEQNQQSVTFDYGYNKTGMVLPFRSQGRPIVLKNEVQFRTQVSVRDTRTTQRQLDGQQEITNGILDLQLRPTLNYQFNQRLNAQAYFERTINNPRISTSFPRRNTRFGIQLRFALS